MARYSIVFVPDTPDVVLVNELVTFGSYVSKSGGNLSSGFFTIFILPLPEIVTVIVTASLAFNSEALIFDFTEKEPTPPEKLVGLGVGKAATDTLSAGVESGFLTS